MTPARMYEYVSAEWIEAVGAIIGDLLRDVDLGSLDYCICEDLTNPPFGRANTPGGTLSWFIRISASKVEVRGGTLGDADIRIVADYATHHELSRRVWAGNPEVAAAARQHRQRATASGELRIDGDLTAAPPAVLELIAQLHDPVAAITA
ncbi:hypothetical protein GPX89_24830 [Nocardia sp. ET3-3]|uniref:SCP2 domain-containing protein n=1 Tax=Nocardia terrae TaxID=2675851 RepID=A0A7K1V1P9_9NOCA|nr:hypothetical protein [Nocardia terrae]MVU80461.1 hypothetical protein [Nocardia terrae]